MGRAVLTRAFIVVAVALFLLAAPTAADPIAVSVSGTLDSVLSPVIAGALGLTAVVGDQFVFSFSMNGGRTFGGETSSATGRLSLTVGAQTFSSDYGGVTLATSDTLAFSFTPFPLLPRVDIPPTQFQP